MKPDDKAATQHYDWPDAKQYKRSIRVQFALVVSVLTALLVIITGYGFSKLYVKSVTQSEIEKLLIEARSFSAPTGKLMIAGNSSDNLLLQNVCKRLKSENSDIFWVGVASADGLFKAHTDIGQVVSRSNVRSFAGSSYRELLRSKEQLLLKGDTIFVNVPIRENSAELGTLSLASSSSAIADAQHASLITVLSIFLIMLPLSILVPTLALRRQLKPIKIIADSLRTISFESVQLKIPYSSKNEFGFLAETLRSMGDRLESARRELAERERMARELEIAREIQMSILPRDFPHSELLSTAGAYRSAREVGGDYYDFIPLGQGRLGIVVADVSGKSLPGMLVMLMTRDLIKKYALETDDPRTLLCKANRDLYQSIRDGMFVTMFYGVLDDPAGKLTFASAGHNPPALAHGAGDEPTLMKTKGYPLALMPPEAFDARLESHVMDLRGGDTLVLYTDGITEAQNIASEEFGVRRLIEIIKHNSAASSDELVDTVISGVDAFVGEAEQYDDITLVAVRREINSGTIASHDARGVAHAH